MPQRKHGPTVKDSKTYEKVRQSGASKEKAARIANEAARSGRRTVGKRGGRSQKLEDQNVDELRKRAARIGIQGRSEMNKAELIRSLRHH
jgi:hypothetical protein